MPGSFIAIVSESDRINHSSGVKIENRIEFRGVFSLEAIIADKIVALTETASHLAPPNPTANSAAHGIIVIAGSIKYSLGDCPATIAINPPNHD